MTDRIENVVQENAEKEVGLSLDEERAQANRNENLKDASPW